MNKFSNFILEKKELKGKKANRKEKIIFILFYFWTHRQISL